MESRESAFAGNHFHIRKGPQGPYTISWLEYYVEDRHGSQIGFARYRIRLFNLNTEIRVYSDDTLSTELFYVRQRAVWEWSPNYVVVDSANSQTIGVIRRDGFGSFASKEWFLIDASGREIGALKRYSSRLPFALRHRFYFDFGVHVIELADERREHYTRRITIDLDLSAFPVEELDRRLAIAFGLIVLGTDYWV